MNEEIRPIAFHLPQFHPIPENDEWWGKGFTEWTNVTKAKPLFKGHYQPHLPSDLGFYDLRLSEAREAQAELAKSYGIHGFCYYHYWFNGRRILERPVEEILQSGKPDFPFMLCWANENWTRRWDGGDETVLLKQNYSEEDARRHIQFLLPIFKDDRYIRVDGKPFFAFYRTTLIPDFNKYVEIFREEAHKSGLELYLARIESFGQAGAQFMNGLDAAIDFQPFSKSLHSYSSNILAPRHRKNLFGRLKLRLLKELNPKFYQKEIHLRNKHLDYEDYVNYVMANYSHPVDYIQHPCVFPSWDNTARRGKDSFLFKNNNPTKYREWLDFLLGENIWSDLPEENFIFINAWNEWAEGNHLEPCQKWGNSYLEQTRAALARD